MVVMNAKLLAFASVKAAQEFAERNKAQHGRQRFYSFQTLWDLAPLPEMNLVASSPGMRGFSGRGWATAISPWNAETCSGSRREGFWPSSRGPRPPLNPSGWGWRPAPTAS